MNIKKVLLLILFTIAAQHISFSQSNFESIVQIEVQGVKRGVGVVTKYSDYIVTALHVVAGMQNIRVYSKAKGRSVPATIVKIHKASDLALLKLDVALNLPPLQISDETPNALNQYLIYGYTKTPEVRESSMDLSTNFFKLTSIIEPNTVQYKWLVDNGFPSPSAQIIRLDDPIQHGDSGSPILNTQGQIIGIADGGLRKGVQRMNWGISTKAHLEDLFNSNEYVNIDQSTLPYLKNARSENTRFNTPGNMNLYYIFSDYLGSIFETAYEQDKTFVAAYKQSALDASGKDIFNLKIDVYEDYDTSATIAIPEGLDFEYSAKTGLLRAWSPNSNVEMNILIKNAQSFDSAFNSVDYFQNELFMNEVWDYRDSGNNYTYEPDDNYYTKSINCTRYDEYGYETSSLIAEILIDDSYVLATSVTVYDTALANENPIDWYYTYAMEACLRLSGFAIY